MLLAEGRPWAEIQAFLFWSSRTIDRWKKRFDEHGIEGLTGRKRGRPFRFDFDWVAVVFRVLARFVRSYTLSSKALRHR